MVVRHHPETGERHLDLLKWGLLPYFTKDPVHAKRPINARAETVATSGMFKSAFARRRCIVPADVFYEWKPIEGGKQPHAIARQDGQTMAFARLSEGFKWPDATVTRTFTIITTYANGVVGELHGRMLVILEPPDWPMWLAEVEGVEGDPAALLRPASDDVRRSGRAFSGLGIVPKPRQTAQSGEFRGINRIEPDRVVEASYRVTRSSGLSDPGLLSRYPPRVIQGQLHPQVVTCNLMTRSSSGSRSVALTRT
jgi:putative SOS response-associated peptidase YedK